MPLEVIGVEVLGVEVLRVEVRTGPTSTGLPLASLIRQPLASPPAYHYLYLSPPACAFVLVCA
jgi:hypothetical protein